MLRARLLFVVLALLATYAFFVEYLPPFKRVHLYSDIENFHYPLHAFAFQALRQGRIPQWDPSIYCGISFAGNLQAALFYPPTWLMYAVAWKRGWLPFKLLEVFVFLHIWMAFVWSFLWLRGRALARIPALLGAALFAFGGYLVSETVHPGVVTGMAWMPLALWGIDESVKRADWRPLWKAALASAMCFLAGFPASWLVLCVTAFTYALASRASWRAALGVCASVAGSLLPAMVQLLPALEARALMLPEEKYGGGNTWSALLPFFVPNWFDANRGSPGPHREDLIFAYLGLPAIFALAWAVRSGKWRLWMPAALPGCVCLFFALNPLFLGYRLLSRIPFLERTAQSGSFYGGVVAMTALFTAIELDDFFASAKGRQRRVLTVPAVLLMVIWNSWQLRTWIGGGNFPTGLRAMLETATAVGIFALGLYALRSESGGRRVLMAATVLITAGIDYKIFGTNRTFNTVDGDVDQLRSSTGIRGINSDAYEALHANNQYRVASDDQGAPNVTDYRMWGLATPQGFDPFLPSQYHDLIENWVRFASNREFYLDLQNESMLQTLGVRFVITHAGVGHDPYLSASPNFRLIGKDDSFYRVYEYQHAKPPFGWVRGEGEAESIVWLPERRVFRVNSLQGGQFFLAEQFFPGWRATVDGQPIPGKRWNRAFQAVDLSPGTHMLTFQYRTPAWLAGVTISLLATLTLIAIASHKTH